jgi:hypothetical protein
LLGRGSRLDPAQERRITRELRAEADRSMLQRYGMIGVIFWIIFFASVILLAIGGVLAAWDLGELTWARALMSALLAVGMGYLAIGPLRALLRGLGLRRRD